MELSEFKKSMNGAREFLRTKYERDGMCMALEFCVSYSARSEFNFLFSPKDAGYDGLYTYWLGKRNRRRLETRLLYLDMFEQYCIVFKVYEKF